MGLLQRAEAYASETIATRRDIHMHPEPGGSERRTSLASARLHSLGIPRTYGVTSDLSKNTIDYLTDR